MTGSVTGTGEYTGGLAGFVYGAVSNCYATGIVTGKDNTGGLVGYVEETVSNCYATGNVTGRGSYTGGLVGYACIVSNCYARGDVTGRGSYTGGLTGNSAMLSNCYATGNVTGKGSNTGGLAGYSGVSNCYATGNVTGNDSYTGGLVGQTSQAVSNCYASGNVTSENSYTGGLVGKTSKQVTNCYTSGNVTGSYQVGGLVGSAENKIANCYAAGNVTGKGLIGGLVGYSTQNVSNSYAKGNVMGKEGHIGGLVGQIDGYVNYCYATGNVIGEGSRIGGLAGSSYIVKNSFATGNVTGDDYVGGLVGDLLIPVNNSSMDNVCATGTVVATGNAATGSLFGQITHGTLYNNVYYTLNITNASALNQNMSMIGREGKIMLLDAGVDSGQMEGWLNSIAALTKPSTTLQVGINGGSSSQITFESSISYDLSDLTTKGAQDIGAFEVINKFLNDLSERATQLGAISNRLESALESTSVAMENLTSSLSTIRDADIAKESSNYIKSQILQQASATLLATANQSPAFALQLI